VIDVKFFASLREAMGSEGQQLAWQEQWQSVADVRAFLVSENAVAAKLLMRPNLIVARNQDVCEWDEPLADGDEVAFFPPVTGG